LGFKVISLSNKTDTFRARFLKWNPKVTLISSKAGLVPEMGSSVEESVKERMDEHEIKVVYSERCTEVRCNDNLNSYVLGQK
jgi:hypothetical protein